MGGISCIIGDDLEAETAFADDHEIAAGPGTSGGENLYR